MKLKMKRFFLFILKNVFILLLEYVLLVLGTMTVVDKSSDQA